MADAMAAYLVAHLAGRRADAMADSTAAWMGSLMVGRRVES